MGKTDQLVSKQLDELMRPVEMHSARESFELDVCLPHRRPNMQGLHWLLCQNKQISSLFLFLIEGPLSIHAVDT
jgi:hypothetical protein